GAHDLDNPPDQCARREVLPRSRLKILRVPLQQPLVSVALNVDVECHPLLAVDQIDDQTAELCWILDPVLRLAEDDAEHSLLLADLAQDTDVVRFELITIERLEARPVEPRRDKRLSVPRLPRQLIRHLQEEQERELLEVVLVREPVISENVAVVPQTLDKAV